mgnify:CR=1 FL=1
MHIMITHCTNLDWNMVKQLHAVTILSMSGDLTRHIAIIGKPRQPSPYMICWSCYAPKYNRSICFVVTSDLLNISIYTIYIYIYINVFSSCVDCTTCIETLRPVNKTPWSILFDCQKVPINRMA